MEWTDDAIVLSLRRHGESRFIAELLTRDHGRHMGLVRGLSKKHGNSLQPGLSVKALWRARLEDHLGTLQLDPVTSRADLIVGDGLGLLGLSSACAVLGASVPEREVHRPLYDAFELLADAFADDEVWPALYVRWELCLLAELGFGLELETCAVSGVTEGLTHVSPRTGRAVSEEEAEPYRDRLLKLPRFLGAGGEASPEDVLDGLKLTGHFLEQRIWGLQGQSAPDARERMVTRLGRQARA